MKKVIQSNQTPTVNTCDVSEQKYYGLRQGNTRGFIVRQDFNGKKFVAISGRGMTHGNRWTEASTLRGLVESLITNYEIEVFEFDDFESLAKWLWNNGESGK